MKPNNYVLMSPMGALFYMHKVGYSWYVVGGPMKGANTKALVLARGTNKQAIKRHLQSQLGFKVI